MTQLALLEKQIDETSYTLTHSETPVEPQTDGTVQLGSIVHLEAPDGVAKYKVVSPVEADPSKGKISHRSPLGLALLGKAIHAWVQVKGPRRIVTYRVLGINLA